METAVATPAASVIDLEAQYLFQNYARYPLVLHRGKGCYVYDTSGKRYLDWELPDPAGKGVDAVRPIRDEIEHRVRGLLAELDVTVPA